MAMLDVTGLSKRFGAVVALDGAEVHARAGTVHALLGENGAGKSTLTRCLGGVVVADAGSVLLDGHPLGTGSTSSARAAGVHTAFQELSLIPEMTVAQSLLFGSEPRNPLGHISRRRVRARAGQVLAEHGVPEIAEIDLDARVAELSLAERQIVEVTRALDGEPRVLILDESTSAMPTAESAWVLRSARAAATRGAVVLYISHRMQEVREVADELTILRAGATVQSAAVGELDDDEVITAMLGRRIKRVYPERRAAGEGIALEVEEMVCESGRGPVGFEVREGEILGLSGLEGQGQQQVMLALAGVIPSTGTVRLGGVDASVRSPADAMAKGIALVPPDRQSEGLFLDRSIRENFALSSLRRLRGPFGIDHRREDEMVRGAAAEVELDAARLDDTPRVLSGGNQQKVVIGRTLLTEPRLLLLADCTRGVDVGTKAQIHELISKLAGEGVSVLMYASDLSEVAHLCHRVAVMSEGSVVGTIEGEALSEESILRLAISFAPEATATASAAPA
jgi:ABC-type sugar transport system ATPase subunit